MLNIAQGNGEYSIDEKVRFYRIAKRSATECALIADVCRKLQFLWAKIYKGSRNDSTNSFDFG
jgi:four helix bundle protein